MIAVGVSIGLVVLGSHATAALRVPGAPMPSPPEAPPSFTSRNEGFLGVEVSSSSSAGAAVVGVAATSPAAKSGIVRGDIVTSFDTKAVLSGLTLGLSVEAESPGTKVNVGWTTATAKHETATVTLASKASDRSTE
jgi:S1-C subfamily serine protease